MPLLGCAVSKSVITGLFLLGANAFADEVKVLHRGDQSLAAFYQAIAGAKQSIDVATFELEPCQAAPKALLEAIVTKAKQGIKVRIVVEAFTFNAQHRNGLPAWLESQSKNIEFKVYGGATIFGGDRPRTHSKMLVIDGSGAGAVHIVGGRNLTDEYFGLSAKLNYIDQDLLVRGSSGKDAARAFNELWGASAKVAIMGDGKAYGAACFAKNSRDQAVSNFLHAQSASVLSARRSHSCSNVDYVIDNPNFMAKGCGSSNEAGSEFLSGECFASKRTTVAALEFMNGTRTELNMNNQYYFPWGRVRDQIDSLREGKKDIEILANATGGIPDMPAHNAAFTCYIQRSGFQTFKGTQKVRLLTSAGALRDSWSLSPGSAKWRIHTKTAIRDDNDVMVGSWNLDPRSYQTNLENAVMITGCPSLAADLNLQYEQLRITAKADEHCAPCKAHFLKANMSDTAFCGGSPTLY